MVYLGSRHEAGRGVTKDLSESVRYSRRAAEGGYPVGMCYLGDMYAWGSGVAQSNREAYQWYLTAAAAGYQQLSFAAPVPWKARTMNCPIDWPGRT
jgi:uncharacterized protein